jgi:hypothetical protein
MPLGIMGIPLGIVGIPLGIMGIPLGMGAPLGMGIPLGMDMPQHMSPGFDAPGVGGLLGCGAEVLTGRGARPSEEPAHVPAKKLATAIQTAAETAAITRLRSRSLEPSSPKNPIVDSSHSDWPSAAANGLDPQRITACHPIYYLTT